MGFKRSGSENEYCVYGGVIDFVYVTKKEVSETQDIIPYDK